MLQKLHHVFPKLKDVAETPPRNPYLYCERKFAKVFISFQVAQVSFPSKFASVFSAIKHHSSVLLLAQKFWSRKKIYIYIYTFVKTSRLMCKYLRFLSAYGKTCQISHVNFELKNRFLFHIFHHSSLTLYITQILSLYISFFE